MLNHEDLGGAEELLGDDEGAQGFAGRAAGVADDVCVAEGDAEGGGGVDAGVHAGYWSRGWVSKGIGFARAGVYLGMFVVFQKRRKFVIVD